MSIIESPVHVPVVAPVTERDVLHRAADLLEEFGWTRGCQGMPWDPDHRDAFCVAGALDQAERDVRGGSERHGYMLAWNLLGITWQWNDEPGRTKAEVVARLREAAEAAA